MHFTDRVVLVTGAASGIGRALAFRLGREGATVALLDRNTLGLEQMVKELQAAGIPCARAVADVRSREQVQSAVDALATQLGPIDILVASAGVSGISLIDDLRVPQVEEIVQVNFLGVVYTIDAVLPGMLRRRCGQIVGIASLAAIRAIPFESAYCASKAALATYLESLRPALRRRGVSVTTIFPGFVRTPLLDGLLATSGTNAPRGTMEVEAVAERITSAIRRRSRIVCFPWTTTWLAYGSRMLPPAVYDWVMTRLAARIPLPY
jgi:short-subunit dehydrogenase